MKGIHRPNKVAKPVLIAEEKENNSKVWAEKDLRKLIHSTMADKSDDGKSTAELARRALGEDNGSPFTQHILEAPPPKKFGQPKFTVYDGRSDPADHIRHYKQVMAYWRNEEALMCRMFPASLGDTALRWFDKLAPAKIDSFRELAEQFTARFITNSRIVKGPEALMNIKKKHDETLREYSQRYFELYQETEDCDTRFAVSTFKFGLPRDANGIYNDLTRRPPKTFNDLLARVDEFSRVEEDNKSQGYKRDRNGSGDQREDNYDKKGRKDDGGRRGNDSRGNSDRGNNGRRNNDRREDRNNDRGGYRNDERALVDPYMAVNTVFNKPIYKIMNEIKGEEYFTWPRPMFADSKIRNPTLKCSYHKDHGHLTETCRTLKQFLESLVEQGHLSKYISREGAKPNEGNRVAEDKAPKAQAGKQVVGVIDAIHGVTDRSESSRNHLRARLARAKLWSEVYPIKQVLSVVAPPKRDRENNVVYQLSFSEEDLEGVDTPHNDALVIMVNICNFDVKRVLIDPGSSSEVMYLKAFNQLKPFISSKHIRQVDSPIYSFSGDAVWPICIVSVPVRIGEMVVVTDFFVMNIVSPYNALLGRNWLGELKAVASPFHQKLKFPTPKGVCVVRGKQEDARYCFNLEIQGSLSEKKEVDQVEQVQSADQKKEDTVKNADLPEPSTRREGKDHEQ